MINRQKNAPIACATGASLFKRKCLERETRGELDLPIRVQLHAGQLSEGRRVIQIASRVVELRRVEDIERIAVKLQIHALGQVKVLLGAVVSRLPERCSAWSCRPL